MCSDRRGSPRGERINKNEQTRSAEIKEMQLEITFREAEREEKQKQKTLSKRNCRVDFGERKEEGRRNVEVNVPTWAEVEEGIRRYKKNTRSLLRGWILLLLSNRRNCKILL